MIYKSLKQSGDEYGTVVLNRKLSHRAPLYQLNRGLEAISQQIAEIEPTTIVIVIAVAASTPEEIAKTTQDAAAATAK
jgi:hypothetical protein